MAIVVFDVEKFRDQNPAFRDETKFTDDFLSNCFMTAEMIVGNTDATSIAPYDHDRKIFIRERLLYLATCHIATTLTWPDGQSGRVSSATEGSVNVSFDLLKTNSAKGDWWNQTTCGALYWVLTSRLRVGGRFYPGNNNHPWG